MRLRWTTLTSPGTITTSTTFAMSCTSAGRAGSRWIGRCASSTEEGRAIRSDSSVADEVGTRSDERGETSAEKDAEAAADEMLEVEGAGKEVLEDEEAAS